MSELKNQIEAILFASGKKVTYEELARLCNTDISAIKNEVPMLKKDYEQRDSPIILSEEADGWKMTVREKYLSLVYKMLPETELSKSVLETLAVIAWKHPVMQSDVIKIRTNKAYEHIDELVERGFISKEKKGRSYLIRVTQKFQEYFDLPSKEAIRKLFQDIQKHLRGEKEEEKEKEHLGELEVFNEEKEPAKPKISIYDHEESREEEKEEEEPEEKSEAPEEEKEESPEEDALEKKIKEIQKKKEEVEEELEEPELQEEPEEKEEESPKEETEEESEEEDGRELSPELEDVAKSNKEK